MSTTNLRNYGIANAYDIGGGRSASFEVGSLSLVVVPGPGTYALAVAGGVIALAAAARRRARG